MAFDTLQETLDLLSNNWNDSNTDSLTPSFIKVTDKKRYDFRSNQDVVIAQRAIEVTEAAGVGESDKNEFSNFNLDIRVFGATQEDHWGNIIDEIKRILKANKVNPFVPTISANHVIEWNGSGPDLSDRSHNMWRKLLPVQVQRFNVSR